jgi:hypothetical protein
MHEVQISSAPVSPMFVDVSVQLEVKLSLKIMSTWDQDPHHEYTEDYSYIRGSQPFLDLGPHSPLLIDLWATELQMRHNLMKLHGNVLKMLVT